ncbi:MAG: CPBP family intramembrane metalloprotease [Butyrivibrio sp.]|nr:CPBP family intramembrane metalloprotease [Butyrivibrio sp.]
MMMDNSTPNAPAYFTYPGKLEGYKKGKPILTALLGVVLFAVFMVALVILCGVVAVLEGKDMMTLLQSFQGGYDTLDVYSGAGALLSMGNLAVIIPALFLAMKITKERPIHTLTSSRGGWNRIFFIRALFLALLVNGLPQVVIAAATGGFSHIQFRYTIPGFIIFVLLVPLQCIAEEYLFRGFIGQTIASWLKNPIPAILISTVFFMISHAYNTLGLIGTFVAGTVLCLVTWRTKGLEVACALHIVNNFFAFLLSGIGVAAVTSNEGIVDFVEQLMIYAVFLALVFVLDQKKGWWTDATK